MTSTANLKLITPQTPEEFEHYREDFNFLHHFFPFKLSEPELRAFLDTRLGYVTLAYVNEILIGSFVMDIYTNSVELHGICRPDIAQVVPNYRRVKNYIYRLIFNDIFYNMGLNKVIIKAEPSNRGVQGFALLFGFHKLPNTDKGRTVWVLSRQAYLNRFLKKASNVQGSQEHTAVHS